MTSSGGSAYRRAAGQAAGSAGSWTVMSSDAAVPASGQSGISHGVYISQFSDAAGSGNFIYEFVELFFDGHP
jgi:hypothetical protein